MKKLLEIALCEYGEAEIPGKANNPRIVQYATDTGINGISDDETPWCSNFVNWCAMKAGLEYTGKPNARSWLNIGTEIKEPEIGSIVVFKRGNSDWQGHVGFFIRKKDGFIYVLGGNQSNRVKISAYPESDLLGYRRLKEL